jgi:hypothetical protein
MSSKSQAPSIFRVHRQSRLTRAWSGQPRPAPRWTPPHAERGLPLKRKPLYGGTDFLRGMAKGMESSHLEGLRRAETRADIDALPANATEVFVARLDDEKAQALVRLSTLRILYQDGSASRLTDEGMKAIGHLSQLESLDLEWATGVTDVGLGYLHALPRLQWLDLGGCSGISDAGVAALRQAIPEIEIDR